MSSQYLVVNGLGQKYRDDDFIEHVICDINTLLETWKGDSSDIKIPNYYSLSKCRARKERARRNSGGIIIYIKTDYSIYIKTDYSMY